MALAGDFRPTRSELLRVRKTLKMAERGHRLLKLKRDALMIEFFKVLDRAREVRSNIVDRYREADEKLAVAAAVEGKVGVTSAAYALPAKPELELTTRNVMGIVVPKIDAEKVRKRVDERGYGIIGTSPRIDEAAEAYEALVEDVIVAAEIETTMRRLIEEIEKVKRRVNALEHHVIPELEDTETFIEQRLEEMERENIFRLKRFKETA